MLVLVFVAAADALASEHPGSTLADTLETESQRLRRVFYDLVEMTRIEAGALVVKTEAVDLTDAVASAAHDLRAETRTHEMKLDIPPNLPFVEADPRMLIIDDELAIRRLVRSAIERSGEVAD